jgi:hypothetical protein
MPPDADALSGAPPVRCKEKCADMLHMRLAGGAEGMGTLPLLLMPPDADAPNGAPPVRCREICADMLRAIAVY